jgi:hypothetical protein
MPNPIRIKSLSELKEGARLRARIYEDMAKPLGDCRYLLFQFNDGYSEWAKDYWHDENSAWFELGSLCTFYACHPGPPEWSGFGIAMCDIWGQVEIRTTRVTHTCEPDCRIVLPDVCPWFALKSDVKT